ncbi:MAG: hypothetical protein OXR82_13885 [Gammaproteobacteria bacterium]|nr:hypothetical protein [Gammaproteobacteria bacterium]MDE0259462.1 hypothetical protein [Gammaproteobacteria bacterium]
MSGLDAAAGVAGLVAKATLMLCLALALAWLARRGSARTLHLLWTTTFVLLLALPVLSLLGPSWSVPILPARDVAAEGASLEGSGDGATAAEARREMAGPAVSSGPSRRVAGARTSSAFPTVESSRPRPRAGYAPAPLTPSGVAFLIWALGCGAALTSLAVGSLRFRKLVREAAPVRDLVWRQQADAIRRRLRVRSQVQILMSPKVPTPMAGGPWRPVILLPSDAEGWSPERRAVVLAHELVHVRRRDALRQVVGRAVVALYWFHPLSWPAWRAATIAAERSCDEEVLELGTRPSEYARHLFSLASGTAGGRALLALPMVQRSQLENRIMSILKRHRPRYSLARTIAALTGIGVAGTLIACANPVPRDPAALAAPLDQAIVAGEGQAQGRVISDPSPELTTAASPVPEAASSANAERPPMATTSAISEPMPAATDVSAAPSEPPSEPDATPVRPEAAQDASRQASECNPGNGVGVMRRAGEWTLQRRVDGMRLCMRRHGNVEMAPDATSIQSMDDDGWLVLESQVERLHRLVITPGPGGLEYDWSIDGRPEAFDDEAEAWRDLMLTVMDGYLDVQGIRGEEASLRGQIAVHRGHVSTLRGRISIHRGHVSTLRGQTATHRGHVAALHGQAAAHRGHIASLRGRMYMPGAEVARVMSRVSAQVELIANQHAMTTLAGADMAEAVRAAVQATAEALERPEVREAMAEMQETMTDMTELSETLSAAADDWTTLADDLQQIERNLAARRAEIEREAAALEREAMQEIEEEIEEYDLAGRITAIETRIAEYDLDDKIAVIQAQIEEYDLDGKIAEIEAQIEEYDLDGRIREIEAQIEELDADRRADEIERSIQDEIAALRSLIG